MQAWPVFNSTCVVTSSFAFLSLVVMFIFLNTRPSLFLAFLLVQVLVFFVVIWPFFFVLNLWKFFLIFFSYLFLWIFLVLSQMAREEEEKKLEKREGLNDWSNDHWHLWLVAQSLCDKEEEGTSFSFSFSPSIQIIFAYHFSECFVGC